MTQETLIFKSSLTIDEIERNFEDYDFFSELMDALKEALAHSKGEKSWTRRSLLKN